LSHDFSHFFSCVCHCVLFNPVVNLLHGDCSTHEINKQPMQEAVLAATVAAILSASCGCELLTGECRLMQVDVHD